MATTPRRRGTSPAARPFSPLSFPTHTTQGMGAPAVFRAANSNSCARSQTPAVAKQAIASRLSSIRNRLETMAAVPSPHAATAKRERRGAERSSLLPVRANADADRQQEARVIS